METKEKIIAISFTIGAIGFNFLFMGLPVVFLNIGLILSLIFWLNFKKRYSKSLPRLYIIGILIQLTHFLEEYYTGFYKELPSFFNSTLWTGNQFIFFNIIWLIIFLFTAIGTFKNNRFSFLVLWFFLLIGCIGNGIIHIGLSLFLKEYFPGTVTSFFLFIIGIIMIQNITSSFTTGDR